MFYGVLYAYFILVVFSTLQGSIGLNSCQDAFETELMKFVIDQWMSSNETTKAEQFYNLANSLVSTISNALLPPVGKRVSQDQAITEAFNKFKDLESSCQQAVLSYLRGRLPMTQLPSTSTTSLPVICQNDFHRILLNFAIKEWIKQNETDNLQHFFQLADQVVSQSNAGQSPITVDPQSEIGAAIGKFQQLDIGCQRQLLSDFNHVVHVTTSRKAITSTTSMPSTTQRSTTTTVTTQTPATSVPSTTQRSTTTTVTTQTAATSVPSTTQRSTVTTTTRPASTTGTKPSTTIKTTLATTPLPPSTSSQLTAPSCNRTRTVDSLVKREIFYSENAGYCPDGTQSHSEALLIYACDSPHVDRWKQGPNVMTHCSQIATYTPVAMFVLNAYIQDVDSLSGIFISCTPNGFKMAVQLCGHPPEIKTFTAGSSIKYTNADNYYIVQYK